MGKLLEVINLKKYYSTTKKGGAKEEGLLKAVDGVSFSLDKNETLGLVGESGCGKTTLGRTILKLIPHTEGEIIYNGKNLEDLSHKQMLPFRRQMQIVFQDPFGSLNPQITIGEAIAEPILVHGLAKTRAEAEKKTGKLLDMVGVSSSLKERHPHEFSGGQRQRIVLARALSLNPQLIILDEPVSALDVSIQAQIMNLLKDLQEELGLAYIFITHDLSVVRFVSERVAVMYMGKIVEITDKRLLFNNPRHPYTQALISAIPVLDPEIKRKRILLKGDITEASPPPAGCRFQPRCHRAIGRCAIEEPDLREIDKGHFVACHLISTTLLNSHLG